MTLRYYGAMLAAALFLAGLLALGTPTSDFCGSPSGARSDSARCQREHAVRGPVGTTAMVAGIGLLAVTGTAHKRAERRSR